MDKGGLEVDLSYLKDVVNCSDEFMIEMIDLFIDQTPGYFEELDQFINESNWSRVAEIAHKIKPSLAFMGVDSARESMAEIEQNARNLKNLESIPPKFQLLKDISSQLYKQLADVKASLQNPS